MKVWRNVEKLTPLLKNCHKSLTQVHNRCFLAPLGHVFWAFSDEISVIRLVDTLVLDRFQIDCSLTSTVRKLCLAFQVSQSRIKILFWVSYIGHPSSRPVFVRFWSGKKQYLSHRLSTLTYQREIFDWTTPLKDRYTLTCSGISLDPPVHEQYWSKWLSESNSAPPHENKNVRRTQRVWMGVEVVVVWCQGRGVRSLLQ